MIVYVVIIGSHNVFSLIPPWTFQTQARWARRLSKYTFSIRWVMDGSSSGRLLLQKWPCLPYVLGIGTHRQTHSAWQRKPWWPPCLRWTTVVKEQRRQGWVTQRLGAQLKWELEYLRLERAAKVSSYCSAVSSISIVDFGCFHPIPSHLPPSSLKTLIHSKCPSFIDAVFLCVISWV